MLPTATRGLFHAVALGTFCRRFDRALFAGNDDLPRRIIIGDLAITFRLTGQDDGLSLLEGRAQ